jgi:hypothetical protein
MCSFRALLLGLASVLVLSPHGVVRAFAPGSTSFLAWRNGKASRLRGLHWDGQGLRSKLQVYRHQGRNAQQLAFRMSHPMVEVFATCACQQAR